MAESKSKLFIKIGILAASSLQMMTFGLVGIIPLLFAQFPDASPSMIQTVFTIPTLFMVPVSMLVGAFASRTGKKIPLVLGICAIFLFGMIPVFFQLSLPVLLVVMACLGAGLGCLGPTTTGLIAANFTGMEQGSLIGKQSAFTNMGGMLMAFWGGLLIKGGWRNAFYIFMYTIPILLIVLFCIPKDKNDNIVINTTSTQKIKLNIEVYAMCAMIFVFGLTYGAINTNSGLLIIERNLGDASTTGFVTSAMSAIGIVVGIVYGIIAKKLKSVTLPIALAVTAIGMFIASHAPSTIFLYFGFILCGIGFSITIPTGLFRITSSVDFSIATFSISLFLSSSSIALFLSPLIMNPISTVFANGTPQSRFDIAAIVILVMSAVVLLYVKKSDRTITANTLK